MPLTDTPSTLRMPISLVRRSAVNALDSGQVILQQQEGV
jgi:hypothetical protein